MSKNFRAIADKTAVSLSLLCALHCLAMPLIVIFLPALTGMAIADEAFHLWLAFAVVPVSLFALTLGCKKHKQVHLLIFGCIGIAVLLSAPLLGHDALGELGEKSLTVMGTIIIAIGHVLNYRRCTSLEDCSDI